MGNFRLTPRALSVSIVALAVAIGTFIYILIWGSRQFAIENFRILPTLYPLASLQEIWFDPSGQLVTTYEEVSTLWLRTWDPNNDLSTVSETPIDFASLTKSSPDSVLVRRHSSQPQDLSHPATGSTLPRISYAISHDASRIAWIWKNKAYVGEPGKTAREVSLQPPGEVSALTFTGNEIVTLLYSNGTVKTWDIKGTRLGRAAAELEGSWRIWSRGPFIALSAFDTGEVARFHIRDADTLDQKYFQPGSLKGSSLAVSESGTLLVGTQEGIIIHRPSQARKQKGPERQAVFLEIPGAVQALAFVDNENFLVGGDFPGLYLVSSSLEPQKIASSPTGIQMLALSGDHLAYATKDIVVVADLVSRRILTERGKFSLGLMFSLLSVLAFVRAVLQDRR